MNFQTIKVESSHLPEDMFQRLFCELMPHSNDFSPSLHKVMTVDFATALNVLPMLGPFDTSTPTLVSAIYRAVAGTIADIPALKDFAERENEMELLAMMEKGSLADPHNVADRLNSRRDALRMERNALEDNREPTFFERAMLEDTLRRLSFICGLEEIVRATGWLMGKTCTYGSSYYQQVGKSAIYLQGSALSEWKPGTNWVFPPTKAQWKAYSARFAHQFLLAYGNSRRYDN